MSDIQEFKHPNQKVAGKVEALSAAGFNQKAICDYLNMDVKTLRKHYKHELEVALMDRTMKVAEALFSQATDPNRPSTTAAIFWLKCQSRGSWIESQEVLEELNKKGIGKIQIEVIGAEESKPSQETSQEDSTTDTVQ